MKTRAKLMLKFCIVYAVVTFVSLLVLGTYGVLHHGEGFEDTGSNESTILNLWFLWGLIPAVVMLVASGVYYDHVASSTANEH